MQQPFLLRIGLFRLSHLSQANKYVLGLDDRTKGSIHVCHNIHFLLKNSHATVAETKLT